MRRVTVLVRVVLKANLPLAAGRTVFSAVDVGVDTDVGLAAAHGRALLAVVFLDEAAVPSFLNTTVTSAAREVDFCLDPGGALLGVAAPARGRTVAVRGREDADGDGDTAVVIQGDGC